MDAPHLYQRTIYLVSCTKSKRAEACEARELYAASDWFAKARAYVEAQPGAEWFILSAEHGLIEPGAVIAPYETTLMTMRPDARRAWAAKVWDEVVRRELYFTRMVFLAGETYREHLELWATGGGNEPRGAHVPMRGLGLGEQKAWLIANTPGAVAEPFAAAELANAERAKREELASLERARAARRGAAPAADLPLFDTTTRDQRDLWS
jgi:hypothetical protein